jgi:hypothetical protein
LAERAADVGRAVDQFRGSGHRFEHLVDAYERSHLTFQQEAPGSSARSARVGDVVRIRRRNPQLPIASDDPVAPELRRDLGLPSPRQQETPRHGLYVVVSGELGDESNNAERWRSYQWRNELVPV